MGLAVPIVLQLMELFSPSIDGSVLSIRSPSGLTEIGEKKHNYLHALHPVERRDG